MNYYYDILLNFQDNYYYFYEWNKDDTIEFIKKIPMFRISSEDYERIFANRIIVDLEFLKKIDNKTKLKKDRRLKYACIFSDTKNAIAVEFNDKGESINKSSLLIDDELSINEFSYNIEISNINYKIKEKEIFYNDTRQNIKIKKIIELEINDMLENKDINKIKYIYYEWFNEIIDNYHDMIKRMKSSLNKRLTNNEYKIYNIIKTIYTYK